MAFLELRGTKVHMVDLNPEGDDPVIMIHGLFSSLAVYYLAIAPLLARRRRVVLYDLRGHGLSERRNEGYTPEILSGDLREVMDALEIPRADIVAYSYGATAALYTTLHHPELVCRLALIEAVLLDETVGAHGVKTGGMSDNNSETTIEKGLTEYTASTGIPIGAAQQERIRSLSRHFHERERLTATLRANGELSRETMAKQLTLPTLLLYGDHSSYRDIGHMLKSYIPTAQLHITEGNHNLPIQQGTWIVQQLEDFFEREKR
jgi:pimeloyl-ACP methyl ester carboxylesterase